MSILTALRYELILMEHFFIIGQYVYSSYFTRKTMMFVSPLGPVQKMVLIVILLNVN
jgi:hypothetical protein